MNTVSKRIEWIDIYKALAIVCMVVGHATGRFNGYIYQFHMAAFFFVSGCTARLERKSLVEVTVGRFFTLLLPLVVFIAGGTVLLKLLSFTPYQLFNIPFLGIRNTFRIWLKSGDLYIQFLGATWFLVVLFEVFVFSKILYALTKNFHPVVRAFFSFAFYIIGYVLVLNNRRGGYYSFALICLLSRSFILSLGASHKESLRK